MSTQGPPFSHPSTIPRAPRSAQSPLVSGTIELASAGRALAAEGKSRLAQAMARSESLCIKCGFCLPACPTYRETGSEASSPRGRLELLYRVALGKMPIEAIQAPLAQCVGCLACETACPSGIRFRDMLEAGRHDEREQSGNRGRTLDLILNSVLTQPARLVKLGWLLYLFRRSGLRRLLGGHGLLRILWPSLARLERRAPLVDRPRAWRRDAAAYLAGAPSSKDSSSKDQATGGAVENAAAANGAVFLFTGCVMDAWFGKVHTATAKVLRANGYTVHAPVNQGCCGALHLHGGDPETTRTMAIRNMVAHEQLDQNLPIIVNAAGCGATLKDYAPLFAEDSHRQGHARIFSQQVYDVSEFLASITLRPPTRQPDSKTPPLIVAYDDPCHLVHAQRIAAQPRELLAQIPGLELVPLAESEWCCGGAGTYTMNQPEMADKLLARKVANIRASGAQVIASGNPGCLLQLRQGLLAAGLNIRVVHPVELLADAYDEPADA